MRKTALLGLFCLSSIAFLGFAEAPVVDDSQNYAMLNEDAWGASPQASNDPEDEKPLAHENTEDNQPIQSNLLAKIQGLEQALQELRGQLDTQAHDLKVLQEQQLTFYKDLDARLRNQNIQQASVNSKQENPTLEINNETEASVSKAKLNPADEQISYLAAYDLITRKRYDDALSAMQTFIVVHPNGGYAANAHYWLGELYLIKKDYETAMSHFTTVVQKFPSSSKAPESMLKIGYTLASSGKKAEAIKQLRLIIKNYPDTRTAKLAQNKLRSMNA